MSFSGFDAPRSAIFPLRTGIPDPAAAARRAQRAEKDRLDRLAAQDRPNILSLPDYLARTGRSRLWRSVEDYNKQAIDRTLLEELLKASDDKQILRLRHLILAADTGGFPKPAIPLTEIRTLIQGRKTEIMNEADAKRAVSDDTENEDNALSQWNRLMLILDRKYDPLSDAQRREEAVHFLEESLGTHYFFLDNSGRSEIKNKMLQKLLELKRIRTAVYFRLLYPETRFPNE